MSELKVKKSNAPIDMIKFKMYEAMLGALQSHLNENPCEIHGSTATLVLNGEDITFESCCSTQHSYVQDFLESQK